VRTLDRYVIRNFLVTLVMFLATFMALRILVHLFLNTDEFAELELPTAELMAHVGRYYAYQSLVYFTEIGGVTIVAAAAFALAMMNHTNELTAMLASGVSLRRVVWPIAVFSLVLSGLILLDQEVLIPRVAPQLAVSPDERPETEAFPIRLELDAWQNIWHAANFSPAREEMLSPVVLARDDEYQALARISGASAVPGAVALVAERALTREAVPGWMIEEGSLAPLSREGTNWRQIPTHERIATAKGPAQVYELFLQTGGAGTDARPEETQTINRPLIVDPQYGLTIRGKELAVRAPGDRRDPWLGVMIKPRFQFDAGGRTVGVFVADEARWRLDDHGQGYWELTNGRLFVPSDLASSDLVLRQSSRWMDYMSLGDLNRLLQLNRVPNPRLALLTRHSRVLNPLYNLVMLLLALPFILNRERNIKSSALLTLVVVGGFYAFIYLVRLSGLEPIWAASLPVLIFGPISAVMLDSVKT
jgi:lipopolysaccharide export LptBFGC system permease protein LptF